MSCALGSQLFFTVRRAVNRSGVRMIINRREAILLSLGSIGFGLIASQSNATTMQDLASAFTGGVEPSAGDITIVAPEIAENGNSVPISIEAPGATSILLMASGNPEPAVATFTFGPAAGRQFAATRIRLAQTQDVIAIAKLADGSFVKAQANVKVTIGGCGG